MAALTETVSNSGQRVLVFGPEAGLVASASHPGQWHRVRFEGGTGRCDCVGFGFRGLCSHLKSFNDALWAQAHAPEAEAVGAA